MKKKLMILIIVSLIITVNFSQMGQTKLQDSKINKTKSQNNSIKDYTEKIDFSKPEIIREENYISLKVDKCNSYISEIGKPKIPSYNTVLYFSEGTTIQDVKLSFSDEKNLYLSKKITPSPIPIQNMCDNTNSDEMILNKTLYQNSDLYPKSHIRYDKGHLIKDGKKMFFLSVHVIPSLYNPKNNLLKYIEKAEITVSYIEPNDKPVLLNNNDNNYDMVIITPSVFSEELKPLKEHKNKHNIKTKIVTLSEIYNNVFFDVKGVDNPEKIKYFLKNAFENWSIEYVLLVGGKEELPVRYARFAENASQKYVPFYITDLYYADIYNKTGEFCSWDSNNNNIFAEYNYKGRFDKMDLYPDLSLGRFPCKTEEEVTNVVNKVINYENSDIENKSWFKKLVICAGDTVPSYDQFESIFSYYNISSIKEFVRYIKENGSEITVREGEYLGDILSEENKEYRAKKLYASHLLPGLNKKRLSPLTINHAINRGAGFLFFMGHGGPTAWKTNQPFGFSLLSIVLSTFLPLDEDLVYIFKILGLTGLIKNVYFNMFTNLLRNNEKLPVFINEGCSCGDFNITDNPLVWKFTKKKNGGSIVSFGCTHTAYTYAGEETKDGLNGYIVHELYKSYLNGEKHAGTMLKNVKCKYLNEHPNLIPEEYKELQVWSLFGDPSLKIGGYS